MESAELEGEEQTGDGEGGKSKFKINGHEQEGQERGCGQFEIH